MVSIDKLMALGCAGLDEVITWDRVPRGCALLIAIVLSLFLWAVIWVVLAILFSRLFQDC